jgi:hypothetical protein
MTHVMLTNTAHQSFGHHHLRAQASTLNEADAFQSWIGAGIRGLLDL